jgi:hypothetical protein
MCDYNSLSKATVQALPVPVTNLRHYLGPPAYEKFLQIVKNGRAHPGHDLCDGSPLPRGSLGRGHYMSPANFQHTLARMNAEPYRCQWCGGTLSPSLVRQHHQQHNHREEIVHHFHPECWKARLVAIAVIFGHVRPEELFTRNFSIKRRFTLRETVIWTERRVFTVNIHAQPRMHRTWQGRAKQASKPTSRLGWIGIRRWG